MTHEYRRNSSFGFIVIVVAILILAVTFAARAQLTSGSIPSNRPSTVPFAAQSNSFISSQTDSTPMIFLYSPEVTYDIGGTGGPVLMGDLNGDGKQDLVVVNATPGQGYGLLDGSIAVLLGNGDGTFRSATNYPSGGQYAFSGAIADFNSDGKPDIVVSNFYIGWPYGTDTGVGVLMGNGDGTFKSAVTYYSGGATRYLTVADVNLDGKPDVLVANDGYNSYYSSGPIGVLLGNGDGTFRPPLTYRGSGLGAWSIAVADLNGDEQPDMVVGPNCPSQYYGMCYPYVDVFLGNGDGTFQLAASYSPGRDFLNAIPNSVSVAIADINNDGKRDVLVTRGSDFPFSVLYGNGDGTFQTVVQSSFPGSAPILRDVNGDGNADLLADVGGLGLKVQLGNGEGNFECPIYFLCSAYYDGQLGAVGDVNGDGKVDVVVLHSGGVGVLLNNSGATPTQTTLVSKVNPGTVNQDVTYVATVKSQTGENVSGKVFFVERSGSVPRFSSSPGAKVSLEGDHAAITWSYAYPGEHSIIAVYSGDFRNAAASTSNTVIEKVRGTSKTGVITSKSPSLLGEPVTFTARVTSKFDWFPMDGVVTFYDGAVPLGSAPLTASYTTSSLGAGAHIIKAVYSGNADFVGSSGVVRQFVIGHPTTTTLASSLNPSIYGQKVTWMAAVSGASTPTGTVTFKSSQLGSTITLGTAPLNASGVATLTRSNLMATYPYPITAVYLGDAVNASSSSTVLNQVVNPATSVASITSSANPSSLGQAVTFTARITSPTVTVTGPVTFTAGNTVLGTAQLSRGTATFTTSALPRGSTRIQVTYPWNSNVARSSASLTQTVQ